MSDTKEAWKPIPGFEGKYELSNHGRIKSLARTAPHPLGGTRIVKEKFLKLNPSPPCNHLKVTLTGDGKRRYRWVHQLVLEVFVGPRPEGLVACHNVNDPDNNHVNNLRWDTQSSNMFDRARDGTMVQGEGSNLSKLTRKEVLEIRAKYAEGNILQKILAKQYSVAQATISRIVNQVDWKHLP